MVHEAISIAKQRNKGVPKGLTIEKDTKGTPPGATGKDVVLKRRRSRKDFFKEDFKLFLVIIGIGNNSVFWVIKFSYFEGNVTKDYILGSQEEIHSHAQSNGMLRQWDTSKESGP